MATAKRPGGYYLGPNGTPHDANGQPVEPLEVEAKAEAEATTKADEKPAAKPPAKRGSK